MQICYLTVELEVNPLKSRHPALKPINKGKGKSNVNNAQRETLFDRFKIYPFKITFYRPLFQFRNKRF